MSAVLHDRRIGGSSRTGDSPPRRAASGGWFAKRRVTELLTGWALIGPSVLLIGVFGVVPVVWSFVLAFQRSNLQTAATWIGTKNFSQMLHDSVLREAIKNTAIYTVLFVPITLVLSLLVAAALNRKIHGITVYRLAVFVPVVTSTVATGVIFSWLFDPSYGIVNSGLNKIGISSQGFFSSPGQALYMIVVMTVWGWLGFGALIFLAALQSVPPDLLEAAQIDGCTKTGAFWRIQVPLLRPIAGFMLVWLTINALQLFDEVYVTTKGGPLHATTVVVYYLYQQAFNFSHAGYAAAVACLLFVVIALISLIEMRMGRESD
ncbi:MAG: sugar ABC transporter permease [Actinomycetia bacterium]|nr:sugar ABC transporter permease [Actinomycetes bacterium]